MVGRLIKSITPSTNEAICEDRMHSPLSTLYGNAAPERSIVSAASSPPGPILNSSNHFLRYNRFPSRRPGGRRNVSTARTDLDRFLPLSSSSDALLLCRQDPLENPYLQKKDTRDHSDSRLEKDSNCPYNRLLEHVLEIDKTSHVFRFSPETSSPSSIIPITLESKTNTCKKKHTPDQILPFRILDAPELRDDFYTTLLAWSPRGDLAIGLAENVCLWTEGLGPVGVLETSMYDVSSLAYSYDGTILAAGRIDGTIQFFGRGEVRPRISIYHPGDIGCMAWKPVLDTNCIIIGKGNGEVVIYDILWSDSTIKATKVGTITTAHEEQVCGLAWNHDGTQFATGGNDNRVCLFNSSEWQKPLFVWQHDAAVKAISFCPWQKSLLATGAGSHDKHVRFYNCNSGKKISELYCGAQITSIHWSPKYKEFCVTFGYSVESVQHRIAIYSWPHLKCLVSVLPRISDTRCVHSIMTCTYDDVRKKQVPGNSIVVASSDDTVKFFDLSENCSWHHDRVLSWNGIFDCQILEMLEGMDGTSSYQIR
ncbi:Cdc20/Fizzy family WD repeat protein [Schizosaccharomyces cryophilus OY26]|uniref:Cdc20/Fizzy family WD repeat protein n=1 Tax=Schizosaccharomyces cryophilus (strain OY26 / ATCC MYA-4695 / CBS 11777 / NBRC 106824 / NRRL Y48691) TaxID=653667 RepID=S9VYE2_SCHCR|nr:Cdc20/Fizzy family WD repeat protein [Schizosaccharomyces cryophilus OY26]EPY52693.1 Cdc20/Fizzy family WD repeat protein [Schizosaccharomyces cryophilus OY26]